MNKNWGNLINNGLNVVKIHVNVIYKDDITQKFHFRLMEFTFLQFGIKSNFLDLLQDKTYMVFMVLHVL